MTWRPQPLPPVPEATPVAVRAAFRQNFLPECRSGHWSFDILMEGHTLKYLLLIYIDEQALRETTQEECYAECAQLTHQLKSRGQYLAVNPLHPTSTATRVRVPDGNALVTDGPFAETREQLGG